MGTIAQKLTYLEDTKTAIGNAIAAKGGSVTGKTFRQYATEISNLPSGGGGTPILEVTDVSDFTGGVLIAKDLIKDINWPNNVTSIGTVAFSSCTGLTSLTIPSTVTSIGESAFYGCTGLTSITIPSTVTSIYPQVFSNCTGLTSVIIRSSSVGERMFNRCNNIATLTFDGVTTIGNSAFFMCTGLTSLTIPSTVTTIGNNSFSSCTGLTSLTIPSTVTSIGNYVFSSCTGLTSLTLSEGITSIGQGAFGACTGLTSLTIPSTVTSIRNNAFYGCTGLTSITCLATTPPSLTTSSFTNTNECPIYVPSKSVETYKTATNWSSLASRIQAIPE